MDGWMDADGWWMDDTSDVHGVGWDAGMNAGGMYGHDNGHDNENQE